MSFLDRFRAPAARSGAVAKQRLKLVLEYDRASLSPGQLDLIRHDIIESISRHVLVDRDEVQVHLEDGARLVAEVPLASSRRPVTSAR
jgi:cell division topological specificity factor